MLNGTDSAAAPILATGTRGDITSQPGKKGQMANGGHPGSADEGETEPSSWPIDLRKMFTFIVATYLFFTTSFIVPIACVSTVFIFLPVMLFSMPLFLWLENGLCRFVNDHWISGSFCCGLQVVECGEDVDRIAEKRSLLLANHLGLMDHFVLMTSLHDKGSISSKWMWVIYNIWKYTPLGVMWTMHGNFFVNGGAAKRDTLIKTFKQHLINNFWKFDYRWIVMYPEGSRLFIIRESGAKFAEKNSLPPLRHCVYPRIGAAHAVMDVAAPESDDESTAERSEEPLEYIIDATIGYPKGNVSDIGAYLMGEWMLGDSRIFVHYSIHKVRKEWREQQKFKEFLYKLYQKKDELLDNFYRTGEFPGTPRTVSVPIWRMLRAQVFWIALYYGHYVLWLRPLCVYLLQSITSRVFF